MPKYRVVILLLALGAVVNVVIAMVGARWGSGPPYRNVVQSTPVSVPAFADEYVNDPTFLQALRGVTWTGDRLGKLDSLSWSNLVCTRERISRADSDSPLWERWHETVRLGFPFRSMQYHLRGSQNFRASPSATTETVEGLRGGFTIESPRQRMGWFGPYVINPVRYPAEPIPLGFAVNTLIYAAVFSLPAVSARALLRRNRTRRGLCARCAYPLGTATVCSECGHTPACHYRRQTATSDSQCSGSNRG